MQKNQRCGTMKNRAKQKKSTLTTTLSKSSTNPVAKALLVSTEINAKPSVIPNKKKYNRVKEKQKWKTYPLNI